MMSVKDIVRYRLKGEDIYGVVSRVNVLLNSVDVYPLKSLGLYGASLSEFVYPHLKNTEEMTVNLSVPPVTIIMDKCNVEESFFVVPLYYITHRNFLVPVDGLRYCRVIAQYIDSAGKDVKIVTSKNKDLNLLFSHALFDVTWQSGSNSLLPHHQLALEQHMFCMKFRHAVHKGLKSHAVHGSNEVNVSVVGVPFRIACSVWESIISNKGAYFVIEDKRVTKATHQSELSSNSASGVECVINVVVSKCYWSLVVAHTSALNSDVFGDGWDSTPFDASKSGSYSKLKRLQSGECGRISLRYYPTDCTVTFKAKVETVNKIPTAVVVDHVVYDVESLREVGTPPLRSVLSGTYYVQYDSEGKCLVDIAVVLSCRVTWAPASNAKEPNIPLNILRVLLNATSIPVQTIELACKNSNVADGLPTVFLTEELFLTKFQLPAHAFDGVFKVGNTLQRRMLLSPIAIVAATVPHWKVTISLLKLIVKSPDFSKLLDDLSYHIITYPGHYSVAALFCAATNLHLEAGTPSISHDFLRRFEHTVNMKYPGLLVESVLPTKRARVANRALLL
jgi:hypothetical protein